MQSSMAYVVQPFVTVMDWRAAETNSTFVTTFTFPNEMSVVTQGSADFDYSAGLKLGLSFIPECQAFWDTKLYWTYYSSNSKTNIPTGDQFLTSLFFSGSFFISEDLFFGAVSHWQLIMNMVDLEASHSFKPVKSLTLTPKIGIKGGTINQKIKTDWDAILYNATERVANDFTGIGPSFGLDAKLNLYKQLNLVGSIATALMYGSWNNQDVYTIPSSFLNIVPPKTISTRLKQKKLGIAMIDYFLGLEWAHEGRSRVAVQLGYEMQYWANQLKLIAVQQLPTNGDLTIQGATCSVFIDL